MPNSPKLTEKEILEALERSGYLFESEIAKELYDYGFFIESNAVSLDPFTGKSREIDLVAEYYCTDERHNRRHENKAIARTKFIFEIKNTSFPLVLMTKVEPSPNSEEWKGMKTYETSPEEDFILFQNFYHLLVSNNDETLYSQYCSFNKKKANEELMALHPENLYSGLSKISCYCEEILERFEGKHIKDEYWRNFFYLPVIIINDDLYESQIFKNERRKLKKVNCSRLIFSYHYKQKPKLAIIYVVTRKGLKEFLKHVLKAESVIEETLIQQAQKKTTP